MEAVQAQVDRGRRRGGMFVPGLNGMMMTGWSSEAAVSGPGVLVAIVPSSLVGTTRMTGWSSLATAVVGVLVA